MMNHPLQQYIPQQLQKPQVPVNYRNPFRMMQSFALAMQNPVAFVKQNLPEIPEHVFNDPTGNSVLQYMMQNLGVTQQDIQNVSNQIPRF